MSDKADLGSGGAAACVEMCEKRSRSLLVVYYRLGERSHREDMCSRRCVSVGRCLASACASKAYVLKERGKRVVTAASGQTQRFQCRIGDPILHGRGDAGRRVLASLHASMRNSTGSEPAQRSISAILFSLPLFVSCWFLFRDPGSALAALLLALDDTGRFLRAEARF